MTNREIAMAYLRCFCAGNIGGLTPLLASDLHFRGTLHHYDSREQYLKSLKSDPPEKCGYYILSITEGDNSVSIFYEYEKPDKVITIAQLFKIKNHQINEVLLVFDASGFA